jgi:hypothetical protein
MSGVVQLLHQYPHVAAVPNVAVVSTAREQGINIRDT